MHDEDPMQRMQWTVVGIACFTFVFDAAIGGGVLLRFLILGVPLDLLFISLVVSSLFFSVAWLGLRLYKQLSQASFFSIGGVLTILFLVAILIAQQTLSPIVFLWVVIPIFNFVSFFLFSEATKALSRVSFYRRRGQLVAVATSISLVVGAVSIYLGVEQIGYREIRVVTLVVLAFTLSFFPIFIFFANHGWNSFEHLGIEFLGMRKNLSVIFLETPSIRNAILASALFLMGSGIAHGVLVKNVVGTQETSRALAYVFTIPFLLILGILSDRVGRTIIIVGAITLNTTSQVLSYFQGTPQLIASFEIAGYYAILQYIVLKLSDEVSPARWNIVGVAWGTIFAVDFLGGLISVSFPFTATDLSIISITLMLIALVLALRTPDPFFTPEQVQGYMVLEKDSILDEKGVDESIRQQIKKILPTISEDNPKPVELEEGMRAAFSKKGDYTAVAFLNIHNEEILKNLKEFAERIGEENADTLLRDLIQEFMDLTIDVDGLDVKFMEL